MKDFLRKGYHKKGFRAKWILSFLNNDIIKLQLISLKSRNKIHIYQ